MDAAIIESHADLLTAVPITTLMKGGTLTLADGRLSFTRTRNRVVFDAPLTEFHSVALNPFGITIWRGDQRYRFAIGHVERPFAHADNPVLSAASVPGAIEDYQAGRRGAVAWVDALAPLVGPTPDGVAIRTPWTSTRLMTVIIAGVVLGTAAVMAVIVVGVNLAK